MLLLTVSVAADIYDVDSLQPEIEVQYGEPVELTNIELRDSAHYLIPLTGESIPTEIKPADYVFRYTPAVLLKDREEYTLNVTATDELGNSRPYSWIFTVRLLEVKLRVIEPSFGVSPFCILPTQKRQPPHQDRKRSLPGFCSPLSRFYAF